MAEINSSNLTLPPAPQQTGPVVTNREARRMQKKADLAAKLREAPLADAGKTIELGSQADAPKPAVAAEGAAVETKPEAATETHKPEVSAEKLAPAPAAKPEPSPLDRLMAEAAKLAQGRKPVAAREQVPAPEPTADEPTAEEQEAAANNIFQDDRERAVPVQEARQQAQRRLSLAQLAEELGADPNDVFRHLTSEYEAIINGKEAPEYRPPPNPAMREVEALKSKLSASEQQVLELKKLVESKFSNLEAERQQLTEQTKLQRAASYLAGKSKNLPYISKSDQAAMAHRLVSLVDLAAQYQETAGLTLDELADRLEADVRKDVDRYKDLFVSSTQKPSAGQAAPESPKPAAGTHTAQTPGTLAPGQLNAGSGQSSSNSRRSAQERKDRALAMWKSGGV